MMSENLPRVLVVDDIADTANTCAFLLRLWGYQAQVCYEGTEAVEATRAYQPHIVLLDIGIPRMDGFEVIRRLREEPEQRHTVLIAVTGYANEACRIRAQESGFQHYLVKPVDPDDLRELIVRVVATLGFPRAAPANGDEVLHSHLLPRTELLSCAQLLGHTL